MLVTLYLGPVALTLYVLSCKKPFPGTHERFIQPLWKQGLGSTIHCVAGDATGIIVAATITGLMGLSMGIDVDRFGLIRGDPGGPIASAAKPARWRSARTAP